MRQDSCVCHINLAKDYRGGERQTELLIRELAAKGMTQRLVIRDGQALGQRLSDLPGLDIRRVASNPVSAAFALRGADLVHAHDGRSVYSAFLGWQLFSVPYVLTRRVVNAKRSGVLRDRAYGNARRIFAVSQAAANALLEFGQRADVVLDGYTELPVDQTNVAQLKERFSGKTLIGHVGALEASKGQRTLFAVARASREEHPDWLFVCLGDGNDQDAYREETAELTNVRLEGFVDNVGDYLQVFDLFAFPSEKEAVGSSLLDAMHAGLPIVASRVGGIPEIIVEGRNGVLLDADDTAGFHAAIEVLLEDREERARLARNNREDVQGFAASVMAAAYAAAYADVLSQFKDPDFNR